MTIPILLLIPLVASGLTALAKSRRQMEILHLLSAAGGFAAAVFLAAEVLARGEVHAWNGFVFADHLGALVVLLTAFVYLACAPYAVGYFRTDERNEVFGSQDGEGSHLAKLRKYYSLTPLFAFSMHLVAVASNLGVMWVALEGTTLASIFLVTFYGRRTSLEAAWKYAMIGGVGLSMALFGTILTYYAGRDVLGSDGLGGLNWTVLTKSAAGFDHTVMRLAFILVLLGYGTKAGLAPMHTWKPDAYSEAPAPVAALMAAAVLNCALYALARFYILTVHCLGPAFPSQLLMLFGFLSIGIAVPFILVQRSYRRLLAYSSIDHGGIMVLALGFGGLLGTLGMVLHMTFHSVAKPLLFFCAGNAQQETGNDSLKKTASGLVHALPVSGPMFLLGALAVTGTPPFSLFQSEFMILQAGFAAQHVGLSIVFVSLLVAIFAGFFYHIAQLVLGPPDESRRGDTCRWKTFPVMGLSALTLLLGFWLPAPLYSLIEGAARILAVQP
ncbi:MAG TPA: proton-conducting transporter membrane subunit [Bryobacteraceae bacterium]|nr:proton-conducting transporter membrane subunit [Bryobacteraceae bacterium]